MRKIVLFVFLGVVLLLTSCKTPDPYIYDSTTDISTKTNTSVSTESTTAEEEPATTITSEETSEDSPSSTTENSVYSDTISWGPLH